MEYDVIKRCSFELYDDENDMAVQRHNSNTGVGK